MLRRVLTLGTGVVALTMVAVLVMGLAGPVSAFAATKHRPVVKEVSPHAGTTAGGATVTITGKYFRSGGKSVVKRVTFGARAATSVRVKSATKIAVTTPAGTGVVDVRVIAKAGKSAKVRADKYTFRTATRIALKAGNSQSASAGAAVRIAPSVIVTDAKSKAVAGVSVTFAVTAGGGSVTGSTTKTNASGIAKVGSWKLGGTAGTNTLTATSGTLTGSPVTFTATGDPGILLVEHNGTPVRAYSLDELKALTPFAGYAGVWKNNTTFTGPEAVTGVKVVDIVKDALGTPLTAGQSVDVVNLAPPNPPYDGKSGPMSYDKLVNLTGFTLYNASSPSTPVALASLTGPFASILAYSDPAGVVMPVASGPLRFLVADATSENIVVGPSSASVSTVNLLNVITTP